MIAPPQAKTNKQDDSEPKRHREPIIKRKGDLYVWHQWSFGLTLSVVWGIFYSFLAKGPGEVVFWWIAVTTALLAFGQIFKHCERLPQFTEVALTLSAALILGVAGYKICFYMG